MNGTYIRTLLAFAHFTVPSSGQRYFSIGSGAIHSLYFPLPYSHLMFWWTVYNISSIHPVSFLSFDHTQVIVAFFSVFQLCDQGFFLLVDGHINIDHSPIMLTNFTLTFSSFIDYTQCIVATNAIGEVSLAFNAKFFARLISPMASRSFEVGGCAGLSFASRFSQMMICDSPPILSGCGLAHGEILGSAGIICSPTCDPQ